MAHAALKFVGACAIASILAPPLAQITIVATSFVSEADAQTGNAPAPNRTIHRHEDILPNGTVPSGSPAPAKSPMSRKDPPVLLLPNGCLPGQVPLLPGNACPPNGSCLPSAPGAKAYPHPPCGPLLPPASGAANQSGTTTVPMPQSAI